MKIVLAIKGHRTDEQEKKDKTKCKTKNLLFQFRTDENAFQIYIPNRCILAKILLTIELKRL